MKFTVAGVGAALALSTSHLTVDSTATVTDVPVHVTVTPASGSGIPSGQVTVSVDGNAMRTGTLGADGTAVVHVKPVATGSHNFSVAYNGD